MTSLQILATILALGVVRYFLSNRYAGGIPCRRRNRPDIVRRLGREPVRSKQFARKLDAAQSAILTCRSHRQQFGQTRADLLALLLATKMGPQRPFEVALFLRKQAFPPRGDVAIVPAVASEFLNRSVSEGGLR